MARDTTYRWISPLKASDYYVGRHLNLDFYESSAWLRPHVETGDVRVQFEGSEIGATAVRLILQTFDAMHPTEAGLLPSNFALNRPDIERLLQNKSGEKRVRRGRPARAGSLADLDLPLTQEMNRLISTTQFSSPTAAAKWLVADGRVAGHGIDDSKVRRLVQRYKARFGDDD